MTTAGLIGLGLLGTAIARRLLQAGMSVTGFDISSEARHSFTQLGGSVAGSALQVFEQCPVVMLSLPDSAVVRQLMCEVRSGLSGHLVIDTTTGDPDDVRQIADMLAAVSCQYVDATVAGSSEQAARGEVVVMAGGDADAYQRSLPWLQPFSQLQYHTGPSGSGATVKLIVNLVLGLNRAVLAEGLHLARHSGIDLNLMLDILKSGAAYSRAMDVKGQKMIDADFVPQARLNQHWKDVRLILELGARSGTRLPLSEVHAQLLQCASERGFGTLDNSAIIEAFRAWRASEPHPSPGSQVADS